jgi:hypothetical protein
MDGGYINQKVMESIRDLIGEESPENLERLKKAAVRACMGVQPVSEPLLSKETARHFNAILDLVNGDDFWGLMEHLTAYIMSSQEDEGARRQRRLIEAWLASR